MLYTIKQLMNKLNRSESFVKLCLIRFNLERKVKIDKSGITYFAYEITKNEFEQIKFFSDNRIRRRKGERKKRNREND